jgi:hypothetical protein
MSMKSHILEALIEQFRSCDEHLAHVPEELANLPCGQSNWTTTDLVAHLLSWLERSRARLDAAVLNGEPNYRELPDGLDPYTDTDKINAWFYDQNKGRTWLEVRTAWRNCFLECIEQTRKIDQKDLLDGSRYPWMKGRPLALSLLGLYDHHQGHFDKLRQS